MQRCCGDRNIVIVLCRHGSTDENVAGEFLSAKDPPLNDLGRVQCRAVRDALRGMRFDLALVSPMRRCLESLSIVAPSLPYECHDALREVNFGTWEGKTSQWLAVHEPHQLKLRQRDPVNFRPPCGESFADAAVRLRPVARSVTSQRREVLIIGHRGALGVLERLLRGLKLDSQAVAPLEPGEFRVLGEAPAPAPERSQST
jgi:alpha-ribazole phosphatase